MSNAGVYRADVDQIEQVLENRKKQGLKVTKFSNTHIVGKVSITDDSKYMMTSIPYSDGWKVKVDGKFVQNVKKLGMLSYRSQSQKEIIRLNSSLDKKE